MLESLVSVNGARNVRLLLVSGCKAVAYIPICCLIVFVHSSYRHGFIDCQYSTIGSVTVGFQDIHILYMKSDHVWPYNIDV